MGWRGRPDGTAPDPLPGKICDAVAWVGQYKWLAWLFDWTSIKQAKICISTVFDQMMEFVKAAVAQLRPTVDNGFAAFKDQFAAMMDEAIRIAGSYSVGGYVQRNTPYNADASAATSNNFFFNEFLANGAGSGPSPTLSLGASDPLTTLASLLTELASVEEDSADTFNQALCYFTNLGKQPYQICKNLLAGMLSVLKGLAMMALDLANTVIDALLDAGRAVAELVPRLGSRSGASAGLAQGQCLAGSADQAGEGLAGEVAGGQGLEEVVHSAGEAPFGGCFGFAAYQAVLQPPDRT